MVGLNLRQVWCINSSVEETLCYNSNCRALVVAVEEDSNCKSLTFNLKQLGGNDNR